MNKHLNVKIYGLVQGVFFRSRAKDTADNLGLTGFAGNETDGSVYIEIEGKKEKLDKFLKWCRKGPTLAKVEKIEITEGPLKNFSEFSIY